MTCCERLTRSRTEQVLTARLKRCIAVSKGILSLRERERETEKERERERIEKEREREYECVYVRVSVFVCERAHACMCVYL
jgi:hypothetical protein